MCTISYVQSYGKCAEERLRPPEPLRGAMGKGGGGHGGLCVPPLRCAASVPQRAPSLLARRLKR